MKVAEVPYTLGYVIRTAVEDAVTEGRPVFITNNAGEIYAPAGVISLGLDHIRFTTVDDGKRTARIISSAIAEVSSPLD